MRGVAVLLTILALVFAGCVGTESEPATDDQVIEMPEHDDHGAEDEHADDEAPHTDNATEESQVENVAPEALLVASVLEGTAPLLVNFSLDGSDADGDNLTWELITGATTLAFGESLPAEANHTFEAGNHTVELVVSDGKLSAATNVTIIVEAVEEVAEAAPIFVTLHMIEGCELCIDSELVVGEPMGAEGCAGWHLGENEFDCGWAEIPAELVGLPYSAFSYTDGTLPLLGTDGDVDVEFYDACSSGATLIEQNFANSFGQPESGIIPEGAGCIVGFEFSWPNLGHTIEFSLGVVAHGE